MAIKSLDPRQQFAVISARDQDLCVGAGGRLQQREGACCKLMFLDQSDLIFTSNKCISNLSTPRKIIVNRVTARLPEKNYDRRMAVVEYANDIWHKIDNTGHSLATQEQGKAGNGAKSG